MRTSKFKDFLHVQWIKIRFSATNIDDAVASAEALKNAGFVIITIAHDTYNDFSQLATQPSYAFHIYPNETLFADSQAVAIKVSNLLGNSSDFPPYNFFI